MIVEASPTAARTSARSSSIGADDSTTPRWTPLSGPGGLPGVAEARLPRVRRSASDTSIVDLRRPAIEARDVAHYYRRVAASGNGPNEDRTGPPVPSPPLRPDRLSRRAGEAEGPSYAASRPEAGEGKTTWELEFDLSGVRTGSTTDIEIEAMVHDFEARKGKQRELAALLAARHRQSKPPCWVLFPESRPYKDYRLIRYATADPSRPEEIEHAVHDRPPLRLDHRLVDRQLPRSAAFTSASGRRNRAP